MIERTKKKNTSKNLMEERKGVIDGFKFPKYSEFLYVALEDGKLVEYMGNWFIPFIGMQNLDSYEVTFC